MSSINRHIANNSDGPTEVQHTSYYPFGGIIADLSSGRDVQYGTKEERRVITGSESRQAKANGEDVRKDHEGKQYVTTGPTTTTPLN